MELPTASQMKEFCEHYTKDQWKQMCRYKGFVKSVAEDLEQAKKIGKQIMEGSYKGKEYK